MARAKKTGQRGTGPNDKEIGLRIRTMRIDSDMSQEGLGEKLGVSFQQVQKYEKGINRVSLARAMQIADILKTSLDQLAGRDGKRAIGAVDFNHQRYKLASSFDGLDEEIAVHLRRLVDIIKSNGKKK